MDFIKGSDLRWNFQSHICLQVTGQISRHSLLWLENCLQWGGGKMTGMGKSVLCCSQSSGIFSICLNCIIFFLLAIQLLQTVFSSSNLFTLPIDTPVGLSSSFGLYHTKVMQLTVVVKEISALAPPEIH